jgi:hypothetical protein
MTWGTFYFANLGDLSTLRRQGCDLPPNKFQEKGGPFTSDGSISLQGCEEVSGTASAKPFSLGVISL